MVVLGDDDWVQKAMSVHALGKVGDVLESFAVARANDNLVNSAFHRLLRRWLAGWVARLTQGRGLADHDSANRPLEDGDSFKEGLVVAASGSRACRVVR